MPENRITATPAAVDELERLRERHGPLILFLSGGCCEGSSPLCLAEGELLLGTGDRMLGQVGGVPFYIGEDQYERWNRPSFELDVFPGETDTLSLENADRVHFEALALRREDHRGKPSRSSHRGSKRKGHAPDVGPRP